MTRKKDPLPGDSKVKVEIAPWDSCIPDLACNAVCPEVFGYDPSRGRAVIRKPWRSHSLWSGEVTEDLRVCVEKASEVCPRDIIRVITPS